MTIIYKILRLTFEKQLSLIYSNKETTLKTIDNFIQSLKKFNFFLKFLIFNYFVLIILVNFILIILFFFKFRINYLHESNQILKKIPLLKNIQNFLIANLLLHTN